MSREGFSLLDIAEIVLKDVREPLSIFDLFEKVCVEKNVDEELKGDLIAQFYADITTSAKFVYVGENTWDLKSNQKIELWEKDGSYYKEYTEIEIPEEYLEKPKPKVVVKPEVQEETVEEIVEEVVEQPIVETVVEEPVVAVKPEDSSKVEAVEDVSEEFTGEDFDEDLFDDFDEEKYNEYMDTYEDQYED